jgi:hypothetical protein
MVENFTTATGPGSASRVSKPAGMQACVAAQQWARRRRALVGRHRRKDCAWLLCSWTSPSRPTRAGGRTRSLARAHTAAAARPCAAPPPYLMQAHARACVDMHDDYGGVVWTTFCVGLVHRSWLDWPRRCPFNSCRTMHADSIYRPARMPSIFLSRIWIIEIEFHYNNSNLNIYQLS